MNKTEMAETIKEWFSVSELAIKFGVSAGTVRAWIHNGLLPAARVGRSLRVRESDVNAFVDWVQVPSEHVLVLGPDDPAPDTDQWIRVGAPGCACGETCRLREQHR